MATVPSFVSDASSKTGSSKRSIERDATRAKVLGSNLDRLVGTTLDKASELDALSAMPADARGTLIQRAAGGETILQFIVRCPNAAPLVTTHIKECAEMAFAPQASSAPRVVQVLAPAAQARSPASDRSALFSRRRLLQRPQCLSRG